jgi:hypothetical protein
MDNSSEQKHFFDHQRNIRGLIYIFFALCALLVGIDLLFHRHLSFADGTLPIEGGFGFYAVYGFVSCVLLVLAAKQMRKVLMRREDYYDA